MSNANEILLSIIDTVESTGGLIRFSDGLHAPIAGQSWVDLGEAVNQAHLYLASQKIQHRLTIEWVDYASRDVDAV